MSETRRGRELGATLLVALVLLLLPSPSSAAEPLGEGGPLAVPSPALHPTVEPPGYRDRSGLTELVVWQGVNGLFAGAFLASALTGGATNSACLNDSDAGAQQRCEDALARSTGIATVSLAAGIAAPILLTRGRNVRTADAILVNRATLIGAMHGYIIPFAAGLEPLEDTADTEVAVSEAQWLSGLTYLGDVIGVGTGAYLAHEYDPDPGTVSFLGTIHTTTFLAALSVGGSFQKSVQQDDARVISAAALASADLALGVGLLYRNEIDVGRNRVFWVDTGAFLGWLAGAGIGSIIAGQSEQAVAIGGTLGMAVGIGATYYASEEVDTWRNRAELADAGAEAPGFALDAPAVRVQPLATPNGFNTVFVLDVLRGRF
jgi:hypothetical protein